MESLRRLIVELHRRSLWQVLGIYAVGSWAGYQVVTELTERMGLPDWVPGFAIVLFVIGLPIVLATAVVQEGAPGLRRSPQFSPEDPTLLPSSDFRTPTQVGFIELPARRQHLLFTWKRALLAGVAAFLLLGLTAGSYMGLRNAGIGPFGSLVASGELDDRERILIAEFNASASDTALASAVTQAFRTDFAQSPVVTVVEPSYVRAVLQRMSRDPATPLEHDVAREVAQRDNIKALVSGEVSRVGAGYVLSAQLENAASGATLASYRETATDSSAILPAIDDLSRKLREKIGESLRTIRADRPLEEATTPSLDALRKYSRAARALDVERDFPLAISLLQEAVALDSTFGAAWRKLGAAYNNANAGRERIVHAVTRSYENRNRLTERERYHAEAFYHLQITRDLDQAALAYRTLLETWPTDFAAWNNLGIVYGMQRQEQKAADAYRRSIETDSLNAAAHLNYARRLINLGNFEEVERQLDLAQRRFGAAPDLSAIRFQLEVQREEYDSAAAVARKLLSLDAGRIPLWRSRAEGALSGLAATRGKLAESVEHRSRASAADVERGNPWGRLNAELSNVRMDLYARRNPQRALERLNDALQRNRMADYPALNRPYLEIAEFYAQLGRVDLARKMLDEYRATVPEAARGNDQDTVGVALGFIAIADKKYDEGIALLRTGTDKQSCSICYDVPIALAFEAGAQVDSAVGRYLHFLETRDFLRLGPDGHFRGAAYERLAELYEQKGDREKAKLYAAKFVELWDKADAELQPRVQAKRDMLKRLSEAK